MDNTPQEFSLDSFLRGTVKFYLAVFHYIINGIKNYWKHWLVLFILFGLAFFFKARKIDTYYNATSSYVMNFLHKKVYGDKFYDLEKLLINNEKKSFSETLEISSEVGSFVNSLEAKNIKNTPLHEDLSDMNVPFYLHVKVHNKDSLEVIQNAITQFICKDKILQNFILIEKTQLKKKLFNLQNEITLLDSLSTHYLKTESEDLSVLMKLTEDKKNQKIQLEKKLNATNPISVLKPFVAIKVPRGERLKSLALKFILMYVFSSLILTTFLYWYNHPSDEY